MNFQNYDKVQSSNKVESKNLDSTYTTEPIVSKSDQTRIIVTKDATSASINYNFRDILPTNAFITKKSITLYGKVGTSKKLLNSVSNLARVLSAPISYSEYELKVNVEYEYKDEYYTIDETIAFSDTKVLSLDITKGATNFASIEAYLSYLRAEINALKSRVSDLEES